MINLNERAAKVLGFVEHSNTLWHHIRPGQTTDIYRKESWTPTTDIRQAWLLVEWLEDNGYEFRMSNESAYVGPSRLFYVYLYHEDTGLDWEITAETAPLAITSIFVTALFD